jgi:dsDNA-specific endonuclease/ATPase MutS2
MPEPLSIGDRVQMLDEALEGRILAIGAEAVRILTEDGLEMEVAAADLVRVPEASASDLRRAEVRPKPEPATGTSKKPRKPSGRKRKVPPMEVDLHAEKLFPSLRNINPYEILDRQLDTARRQLEFAMSKRIQRVVFIHGVGQGVLREELRTLFRRYEGIQYKAADFRVYGEGATEVYIPQSCFT